MGSNKTSRAARRARLAAGAGAGGGGVFSNVEFPPYSCSKKFSSKRAQIAIGTKKPLVITGGFLLMRSLSNSWGATH